MNTVTVLAHAQSTATAGATHQVTVATVAPRGVKGKVATASQVASQVKNADAY